MKKQEALKETQQQRNIRLFKEKRFDELYIENQNFIYYMAKKFKNLGEEEEDLISYANIAFTKALNSFNPDKGYEFVTYLSYAIKTQILRYANLNNKPIHQNTVSYDAPAGNNGTLLEFIDQDSYRIEEAIENKIALSELDKWLDLLKPREKEIMLLRLENKTLEQIGNIYDITKERVRQIEKKSIKQLNRQYVLEEKLAQSKLQSNQIKQVSKIIIKEEAITKMTTEPIKKRRLRPTRLLFEQDHMFYEIKNAKDIFIMNKSNDMHMLTLTKQKLEELINDLEELYAFL